MNFKPMPSGILNQHGPRDIQEQVGGAEETDQAGSAATATAETVSTAGMSGSKQQEVIPVAEEELQIGERTVDRGTTRIRRYVNPQAGRRERHIARRNGER